MKKVFVLTFSDAADFENYPKAPFVFEKKEDALSAMKSYKEDFLKEIDVENDTKDGDGWVVEDCEMSFSAYIDGRYAENHYDITIYECRVN